MLTFPRSESGNPFWGNSLDIWLWVQLPMPRPLGWLGTSGGWLGPLFEHPEVSSTWASIQEDGIRDLYQPKREVGVRWGWGLALGRSAQVGWPGRPGTRCGTTVWSTELGGRSLPFPLRSFQWVFTPLYLTANCWKARSEANGFCTSLP